MACRARARNLAGRLVPSGLSIADLLCAWRMGGSFPELSNCFLGGGVIQAWNPPLRSWAFLLCVALWLASLWADFRVASAAFGAYAILYVGLSPAIRLPKVTRWGDLSYGTYIWAFPIEQGISLALGNSVTWYANLLISLPIILTLAFLSWRFVEGPALELKKRVPRAMIPAVAVPQR